jgi:hypothetical protein
MRREGGERCERNTSFLRALTDPSVAAISSAGRTRVSFGDAFEISKSLDLASPLPLKLYPIDALFSARVPTVRVGDSAIFILFSEEDHHRALVYPKSPKSEPFLARIGKFPTTPTKARNGVHVP